MLKILLLIPQLIIAAILGLVVGIAMLITAIFGKTPNERKYGKQRK